VRDVLSGRISVKIQGIQVLVRPCKEAGTHSPSPSPVPDLLCDHRLAYCDGC
jgi:hypothetical protein